MPEKLEVNMENLANWSWNNVSNGILAVVYPLVCLATISLIFYLIYEGFHDECRH